MEAVEKNGQMETLFKEMLEMPKEDREKKKRKKYENDVQRRSCSIANLLSDEPT